VAVVCAETDEEAHRLALPGALAFLRLRQGKPGLYPSPEEAADYNFTAFEREAIRSWTSSHVIGDPASVRAQLEDLLARTGADELMLTTMLHATDDRIRSYELVADEVALDRAAA
jgi:alkanesulfonate monooxygenase SsuD/methylene tetrahydromethanopterin reductase-like flavin-dependent oxidoreductase (luciferase family)